MIRIALVSLALLIALGSVWYTQWLVFKLGQREQRLVDLYAKGLSAAAISDSNNNLDFLFQEIIQANESIPVILTDDSLRPLSFKNIEIPPNLSVDQKKELLRRKVQQMLQTYPPIKIEIAANFKNYVVYENSSLLRQLRYYPYLQILVIVLFMTLGYWVINRARSAEQNKLWVGMAKETAHQLGTPISSLMAWMELFRSDDSFTHKEALYEISKDIHRLETVASRFSSIGSTPTLQSENVVEAIKQTVDYLKLRISKNIEVTENYPLDDIRLPMHPPLFSWALENIIKNSADAMQGKGKLSVEVTYVPTQMVSVDIIDSGKGISKENYKKVFEAGYTTKARGWGLGLTLTKRIIEHYHGGKVYVKQSEINVGTTIRIQLYENSAKLG